MAEADEVERLYASEMSKVKQNLSPRYVWKNNIFSERFYTWSKKIYT